MGDRIVEAFEARRGGVLMKYKVQLERTEEGFAVWCPGAPGVLVARRD